MDSVLYSFYQSTTRNILKAHKFLSEEQAQKACSTALNGEIETLLIMNEEEYNKELNVLKDAYKQLKKENEELKKALEEQSIK